MASDESRGVLDNKEISHKLGKVIDQLGVLNENIGKIDKKCDDFQKTLDKVVKDIVRLKESFKFINREFEANKLIVDGLNREVTDLKESVSFMSEKFEKNQIQLDKVLADNKHLREKGGELEGRLNKSEKGLTEVKKKAEGIVRREMASSLELSNVAKLDNEKDLKDLGKRLVQKCGLNWSEKMIEAIYRKRDTLKGNPGNIVIRLVSKADRDDILKGLRVGKLKNSELGLNGDVQVYGRELLTKEGEDIFFKALKFKKENSWKFLWIRDGKVFIRKEEGLKCFLLADVEDINKL